MKIKLYYNEDNAPMTYEEVFNQIKEENYDEFCKEFLKTLEPGEIIEEICYGLQTLPGDIVITFEKALEHFITQTIKDEYEEREIEINEKDRVE